MIDDACFYNILTIARPQVVLDGKIHSCTMRVVSSRTTPGGRRVREVACECGGSFRQLEYANVARQRGARH